MLARVSDKSRKTISAMAEACHQRQDSAEPLWFAVMCRKLWGANAPKELEFKGGDVMSIYFIVARGRIKIGTTRGDVQKRINAIGKMNPHPLKLYAAIEGGHQLERAIHQHFSRFRVNGEWFSFDPELRRDIDILVAEGPSALGLEPAKPKKHAAPQPQPTAKNKIGGISGAMWPDDPIGKLMAFTGLDKDICQKWMDGDDYPPHIYRYAFAALAMNWMFGKGAEWDK